LRLPVITATLALGNAFSSPGNQPAQRRGPESRWTGRHRAVQDRHPPRGGAPHRPGPW